jgi:hypothetical protein
MDKAIDFDKANIHWARIKRANYSSVEALITAYRKELNQSANLPIALLCLLLQVRDDVLRIKEDLVILNCSLLLLSRIC